MSSERQRIEYTNKDYDSLRTAMLELAREKLPEWTDHSDNDLGVVLVQLFAHMGDVLLYYQDRMANESYLHTAEERRSALHLLRLIGYELRPPQPASADLMLLFSKDAKGIISLPNGTEFVTSRKSAPESQSTSRTTSGQEGIGPIRFRHVGDPLALDMEQDLALKIFEGKTYRVYEGLRVIQVDQMMAKEVLASSDGSPRQRYRLARKPLIAETLQLDIDEGGAPRRWQPVETLLYSGQEDTHFLISRDEKDDAWIEFGDGTHGKVPRRGFNNIVATTYLVGGGKKGNVAAQLINKPVTPVPHLERVFNPEPASGGTDAEAIADAALRAPHLFRSMGRAVTAQDYEFHARQFGVGKVRARAAGWNRVELYVAPCGGGQPSETLKGDLLTYFDSKRILTTLVDIRGPAYVPIALEGRLYVEHGYFQEDIRRRVESAVSDLFAFDKAEFGSTLYVSKIYEAIEAMSGVAGVDVSCFCRAQDLEPVPYAEPEQTLLSAVPPVPRTAVFLFTPPRVSGILAKPSVESPEQVMMRERLPADGRLVLGWSEIPTVAWIRFQVEGGLRAR